MLRRSVAKFLSAFVLAAALAFPMTAYAVPLDELTGGEQPTSQNEQSGGDEVIGEDDAISAYMRGRKPVTGENMQKATTVAAPIVNALGTISGFIIMVTSAAIFAITACDLAYIGIPPLRGVLNPGYAAGGAAGGMGMGGMGMGGMGMRGGMGMHGAAGGGGAAGGICWVSDEAKFCVSQSGGGQPGAMGGAMGGMGAMGGAMGGMQGGQQQGGKSVVFMYLKKRSFFIIVFTICTVVLMSSLFTDCGLNLAALLSKVVGKFSSQTTNVTF